MAKEDKLQEAKKVLAEENQKKLKACAEELEQVLTKHGFSLQVSPSQIFLAPKQ